MIGRALIFAALMACVALAFLSCDVARPAPVIERLYR